jgi:hypothetical protein
MYYFLVWLYVNQFELLSILSIKQLAGNLEKA